MRPTVKSVDLFGGPIGSHGFRSGTWTATCEDGSKFKFFGSLPHQDGMNQDRMIASAQASLENGRVEWIGDQKRQDRKIYAGEDYATIRSQMQDDAQRTMERACAIIENALRDGADVDTEFDCLDTGITSADERGPYKIIQVGVQKCGWTRDKGLWGHGRLPSDLIPYNIEAVYRRCRDLAFSAARTDAIIAAEREMRGKYDGKQIYVRSGSKFQRI